MASSDFDFDSRLERLFSQPPRVIDPEGFARRVEARLDREWSLRRLMIGAAGVAGAAVALSQVMGSEAVTRMQAVAEPARRALAQSWTGASAQSLIGEPALWSGEALWTLAALGGLAAAFVATRWAEAL